jgi:hypothetical protein
MKLLIMQFSPISRYSLAARPGQTTNTYRILMVKLFRMNNIKIDFKKWDAVVLTGFIWLRMGTSVGLL